MSVGSKAGHKVSPLAGRTSGVWRLAPVVSEGVVYLRKDGRFFPRPVTLGARNDNDVLVTKGLKAGDIIAERLPPASLIGPASRPRQTPVTGLLGLLPKGKR